MNPLDPRDPKNLIAYQIFFGDEEKPDRTSRGRGKGGCEGLGCVLVVFAAVLLAMAVAMLR